MIAGMGALAASLLSYGKRPDLLKLHEPGMRAICTMHGVPVTLSRVVDARDMVELRSGEHVMEVPAEWFDLHMSDLLIDAAKRFVYQVLTANMPADEDCLLLDY